ncbi:hypothetical protein V8G54_011469 [Vigna mungo]|uniref:Uncharacterized protein n=1 Tax=Vigna mungo TaxID=3915 RepID=A0AAQ3NRC6_VIGMU
MVLRLQVPQRLRLELICDNPHTPVDNTPSNSSNRLPQNLLGILRILHSTSEHSLLKHTTPIGEIHHKLHQTLPPTTTRVKVKQTPTLPPITRQLKKHGVPNPSLGLSLGLPEPSIKPPPRNLPPQIGGQPNLAQKSLKLSMFQTRQGHRTTSLIEPIEEQVQSRIHLVLAQSRTRRSLGTLQLLHTVLKHGQSTQIILPTRQH